jgi:hypothetical protein
MSRLVAAILAGLPFVTLCPEAQAAACTRIEAVPYTITAPGRYCLAGDLTTASYGILVFADDVDIDLAGHRLLGPLDPGSPDSCISAYARRRISVRNGIIRGCAFGVYLSDLFDQYWKSGLEGGHHVVENVEISQSGFRGIRIEGNGNVVRGNIVRHVGGSTVFGKTSMIGIESYGPGATIEGNSVHEVRGWAGYPGEGVGISVTALGAGSVVRDNLVSMSGVNHAESWGPWPSTSRSTWGIWIGGAESRGIVVESNRIVNAVYGITIHRDSRGVMTRNTVAGAVVPFYLPSLDGHPASKLGRGNACDKADCLEVVEDEYYLLDSGPWFDGDWP